MLSVDEIRALLRLEAHPLEGGYFVETWRSTQSFDANLPGGALHGRRSVGTAIYYLLTPDTFSAMHRLPWDEVFHFYLGDPVEMLLLEPGLGGRFETLGTDLRGGMRPQILVPAGVWQGSRLRSGGRVALLGTTMAPGFDPLDFETADPAALTASWPEFGDAIRMRSR